MSVTGLRSFNPVAMAASKPALRFAGGKAPIDPAVQLQRLAEMRTQTFRDQFKQVIDQAKAYMQVYLQNHEAAKTAAVLDLDETLFDNSALELLKMASDKPYWKSYRDWVESAEAPAIPETLDFIHWLKDQGVQVYFVSARKENLRAATERNLTRIGLPPSEYAGLKLKPDDFDRSHSAAVFKVEAQKEIEATGQKVAMVMGDQDSDLDGALGQPFKLPNPLYNVH